MDHHHRCFSIWMERGGVKLGWVYGETGELGYKVSMDPEHVQDFQVRVLHMLMLDHEKLVYKDLGRRFRFT